MTRAATARLAGATFLLYIAAGLASMALSSRATADGAAARLAAMAANAMLVRVDVLLGYFTFVCAAVLAVTLWELTRDVDPVVAALGLCFRLAEGMLGIVACLRTLGLAALASTAAAATGPERDAMVAAGGALLKQGSGTFLVASLTFALGSTCFSALFVRGGLVPRGLAWLGVTASGLLVAALPLQLLGLLAGTAARAVWAPMLVFEVSLAGWLLVKGAGGR